MGNDQPVKESEPERWHRCHASRELEVKARGLTVLVQCREMHCKKPGLCVHSRPHTPSYDCIKCGFSNAGCAVVEVQG